MSPERVQRRRTKGWKMPENTTYVGRGSRWGNPYAIEKFNDGVGDKAAKVFVPEEPRMHYFFQTEGPAGTVRAAAQAAAFAVEKYRERWTPLHLDAIRAELAGKNLACWCPHDLPCHADVLLQIANQGTTP